MRSWDCGGIATPGIEVSVSIWSNFADNDVVGHAVSYADRSNDLINEPIEPAGFEPFTDYVLEPAQRAEIRDWLARTWAISSISAEFDDVHARRFGASLSLDLRFSAP